MSRPTPSHQLHPSPATVRMTRDEVERVMHGLTLVIQQIDEVAADAAAGDAESSEERV